MEQGGDERKLELMGLLVVLVLALVLRLRHFDTLLPWFTYLDETRNTSNTLRLLQMRTLDPAHSFHPGFGTYINAAFYLVWAAAGQLTNLFKHGPQVLFDVFQGAKGTDPNIIMLSRWVSLFFGMGSIVFTYLLARQYMRWRWAMFCALLLCLNSMHISMSGQAKEDTISLFWFIAGAFFAVLYHRRGGIKRLVPAAVCAGLLIATKYNFLLITWLFFLLVFKGLGRGGGIRGLLGFKELWLGLALVAVVAFIGSPYSFIHFDQTLKAIGWLNWNFEHFSFYHTDPHVWWRDRYFYILTIALPFSFGLPLVLTTVAGTIHHARKRALDDPNILILLVWFLYLLSSQLGGPKGSSFPYYLTMASLPLGLLVSVEWLQDMVLSARRRVRITGLLISALVLCWSLLRVDAYWTMFYSDYDQVGQWLSERSHPGCRVLMVTAHNPTGEIMASEMKTVWPQDFTEEYINNYDPDILVIDQWTVAGFRKVYREMWVASLTDSIISGEHGHEVTARFKPEYFNRAYYAALDPEHDVEIIVLERTGEEASCPK